MIRSLLICDDVPNTSYGTGQRIIAHRRALSKLGECRLLHLTNGPRPTQLSQLDFIAHLPFDYRSSKLAWVIRNITLAECRPDRSYVDVLENIHKAFSYDIAFCSFFRNSCVAPTYLVPCLLDVDAVSPSTGALTRLLWPLTRRAMQQRAKAFKAIYVIRQSDKLIFGATMSRDIKVLPGISVTARPGTNSFCRNKRVLLVGSPQWKPNRDAIDWLLSLRVPVLLNKMGYELRLVGAGTDSVTEEPGLSCGGFVDDLSAEYRKAVLVLCPIFSGGGANIKLAEAVQFGCPVLASIHAAAGFDGILVPEDHIEVFSSRSMFIEKLTSLLQRPDRLEQLRERAIQISQTFLNQDYCNLIIAEDIRRILGSKAMGQASSP
jgi:glycosyltransferase involved in cell wall biosynthesis